MLNKDQYYTGTVTEVVDPVLYQIKVDIPGMATSVMAYPMRGEIDEPRVGDFVLLRSLDPIYNSYFLYQKIKENDFIGFRSNGKIVDITPDYILIGIFEQKTDSKEEGYYNDRSDNYRPDIENNGLVTDWIKLDKDGKLEINLRSNSEITINGGDNPTKLVIGGDSDISIGGNSSIKVDGNTELECPSVKITSSSSIELTGGGSLKTGSGTCTPNGSGGFCGIPTCPFTGAPHIGNEIIGI